MGGVRADIGDLPISVVPPRHFPSPGLSVPVQTYGTHRNIRADQLDQASKESTSSLRVSCLTGVPEVERPSGCWVVGA